MIGPLPSGTYTGDASGNSKTCWENLQNGKYYQVVREFFDSDQDFHQIGETWKFLGCTYNQYDEGLSLFVTFDNLNEWHVHLQHTPDEQGVLLDNLADFIAEGKEPKG